jgi:sialic acid synthase
MQPPKVIAEIGQNHNGQYTTAIELIHAAARCGAYGVKFQKRNVAGAKNLYGITHSNPDMAYGENYGWHRSNLEFDIEYHKQFRDLARELSMIYGCSVFDLQSAKDVLSIEPDYIKVGSGCNLNYKLIAYILKESDVPLHISTGATNEGETKPIKDIVRDYGAGRDVVYYHCISGYPVAPPDMCLWEILAGEYEGFSNHSLNMISDIVAFAFGAEWIERHFTFSRDQRGSDHAVSLTPDELRWVIDAITEIAPALKYREGILDCEKHVREGKLKKIYSYDMEDE